MLQPALNLFDANKTVGELAVALPNATRVFEKYKIDYCCGGNKSLRQACAEAGVDFAILADSLAASEGMADLQTAIDLRSASLTELMNHILDKHHNFTREELARLELLFVRVCAAHSANHPELLQLQELFRQLTNELTPHLLKEEQILFPYIMQLEAAVMNRQPKPQPPFITVQNPIRMMLFEHDAAGELLKLLREVSWNYEIPSDACLSYRALWQALEAFEQDLHQHIHLENNLLFPRAIALEQRTQALACLSQ